MAEINRHEIRLRYSPLLAPGRPAQLVVTSVWNSRPQRTCAPYSQCVSTPGHLLCTGSQSKRSYSWPGVLPDLWGKIPALGFDFPEAPITPTDIIHIINDFLKSYLCVNQNSKLVCSNLFADVPVFVHKSN